MSSRYRQGESVENLNANGTPIARVLGNIAGVGLLDRSTAKHHTTSENSGFATIIGSHFILGDIYEDLGLSGTFTPRLPLRGRSRGHSRVGSSRVARARVGRAGAATRVARGGRGCGGSGEWRRRSFRHGELVQKWSHPRGGFGLVSNHSKELLFLIKVILQELLSDGLALNLCYAV